jgi:hypothetical protein
MPDLTREDLGRFLVAWKRAYLPMGLVTPSIIATIAALEQLALRGGMLMIDEPADPLDHPMATNDDDLVRALSLSPDQAPKFTEDDIPF